MKLSILLFSCMCKMLWPFTASFVQGTPFNQAEKAMIGSLGVPVPLVAMVKTIDEGNITIITGTHTKQTKQKDIQKELLKEVEKGNEQRKNANMEENIPRPRKVANTASINTTGHKTTNITTTTTTKKSKLILAKPQRVCEDVELNSYQNQSKLIKPIQSETVEHKNANQNLITEIVFSTAPTTTSLGVTFSINRTNLGKNASTIMAGTKKNVSTASTTVSLTTTTMKMTLTTTLKPTKPKVTFSGDIHPEWDIIPSNETIVESKVFNKNIIILPAAEARGLTTGSLPVISPKIATIVANNLLQQYEPPQVQPSQEKSTSSIKNDYIVHFFTIIVTLPLAIGVSVTIYRRLRAIWSTRHYHRMDFLVDGMYND